MLITLINGSLIDRKLLRFSVSQRSSRLDSPPASVSSLLGKCLVTLKKENNLGMRYNFKSSVGAKTHICFQDQNKHEVRRCVVIFQQAAGKQEMAQQADRVARVSITTSVKYVFHHEIFMIWLEGGGVEAAGWKVGGWRREGAFSSSLE